MSKDGVDDGVTRPTMIPKYWPMYIKPCMAHIEADDDGEPGPDIGHRPPLGICRHEGYRGALHA